MKFDLKKPCKDCPFLKEGPFAGEGGLGRARGEEIAGALRGDGYFSCHKTVDYVSDRRDRSKESFCAGALLVMKNEGILGGNMIPRMGMRFGMFDPDSLSGEDEVYATTADFIDGMDT